MDCKANFLLPILTSNHSLFSSPRILPHQLFFASASQINLLISKRDTLRFRFCSCRESKALFRAEKLDYGDDFFL